MNFSLLCLFSHKIEETKKIFVEFDHIQDMEVTAFHIYLNRFKENKCCRCNKVFKGRPLQTLFIKTIPYSYIWDEKIG